MAGSSTRSGSSSRRSSRRRAAGRRVGPHAEGHRQVTSGGGPLIIGLVAFSAVLHVAWNVRLKTAGDPLRAATVGMLAAAVVIVPARDRWSGRSMGMRPSRSRASGSASARGPSRPATSSSCGRLSPRGPLGRLSARPRHRAARGGRHRGRRPRRAARCRWVARGVALLVGFLWLQRPWREIVAAVMAGPGRAGARSTASILFALATGRDDRDLHRDRPGRDAADRSRRVAAILWVDGVYGAGGVGRVRRRRRHLLRGGPEENRRAAVGGLADARRVPVHPRGASVAPLSGVAPLRESATVFAAAWGSVRLGEAARPARSARRVGASVLIVSARSCSRSAAEGGPA